MTYKQLYSDYMYLATQDGMYDFCGACCSTDLLLNVLSKNKTISETLLSIITGYFSLGYEDTLSGRAANRKLLTDKRCLRIKERYGLDYGWRLLELKDKEVL